MRFVKSYKITHIYIAHIGSKIDTMSREFITPDDVETVDFYRLLTSCVVPRPIAWVSTCSKKGVFNLAPYSLFSILSSAPPIVAFTSVQRKKHSAINAEETGEFVINIASADMIEELNKTGYEYAENIDEFAQMGIIAENSNKVQAPRVQEIPIAIECKTQDVLHIGNSYTVTGEIVGISVRSEMLNERQAVAPDAFSMLGKLAGPWWATNFEITKLEMV